MEWFLLELQTVLVINLLLWGCLFIFPPVVIFVDELKVLKLRPWGLALLNFIFIRRDRYSESILRHELEHLRQFRLFSPVGLSIFILFHYGHQFAKYRSFVLVYRNSILEKWANDKMNDFSTPLPKIIFLNKR